MDSETRSDKDVTLEGTIETLVARVAAVVLFLVFVALSIASMRLLGFDVVGLALVAVFLASIAVGWWRLRREPQS